MLGHIMACLIWEIIKTRYLISLKFWQSNSNPKCKNWENNYNNKKSNKIWRCRSNNIINNNYNKSKKNKRKIKIKIIYQKPKMNDHKRKTNFILIKRKKHYKNKKKNYYKKKKKRNKLLNYREIVIIQNLMICPVIKIITFLIKITNPCFHVKAQWVCTLPKIILIYMLLNYMIWEMLFLMSVILKKKNNSSLIKLRKSCRNNHNYNNHNHKNNCFDKYISLYL
jgi:hypothetical protein